MRAHSSVPHIIARPFLALILIKPAKPKLDDNYKRCRGSKRRTVREDLQMTKSIDALKTIARYVEAKKPKTLAEAEHMLDLLSVMADETILDEDAAESSLAKGLISKPFPL